MKKILILNGPNLNMLGIREKHIYGELSYLEIIEKIKAYALNKNVEIVIKQSNYEGELVTWIQEAYFDKYDGLIINPAAYTHTSIAIADAIKAIAPIPVIEVHLSDIDEREVFRKVSYCAEYCVKKIKGYGYKGYLMAIDLLIS